MFNLSEWLQDNLIEGTKKGIFAREYAAMLAANYMLKGIFTSEQVQEIAAATAITQTAENIEEEIIA